ncbi:MAG: NTP transferase domain-containing protein, partial [Nannocystaceae bacterium]
DAIVLGQTEKGPHPLLAAYRIQPALDATEAARMRGERAARAILESLKIHVIERVALRRPVAMNPCNTPQELEAMETLIAGTNDATVRDMSSSLVAIILAAGKGTRMRSDLPKVLHALGGRPLLHHVLDAAAGAGVGRSILVVGHGAAQVEESVTRAGYGETAFARQPEQRGTGHAVQCALPSVHAAEEVALILSGDVPGMSGAQLRELVDALDDRTSLAMMTFEAEDPTGYGRVLRDEVGEVTCIREQKDASESELQIRECNAGIYAVRVRLLREALPTFSDRNAAGEVYLTDLIDFAARSGRVGTLSVRAEDVVGVNTPEQLAALERRFHDRSGA